MSRETALSIGELINSHNDYELFEALVCGLSRFFTNSIVLIAWKYDSGKLKPVATIPKAVGIELAEQSRTIDKAVGFTLDENLDFSLPSLPKHQLVQLSPEGSVKRLIATENKRICTWSS